MLPTIAMEPLKQQLIAAKRIHQVDLNAGYGAVYLPYALERKYPNANRSWLGSSNRSPCYPPFQNRACEVTRTRLLNKTADCQQHLLLHELGHEQF